jgi:hypothetical protein
VEGFLPIGSDQYLDPDHSFGVVRAKIIVERPSSVDETALFVVDPRNGDAPGFLGRKLLRRMGTALLSFVPGVLSQASKNGGVLLPDEFDLCPPKVLTYSWRC